MPMGTSPFTILGGLALLLWIVSGQCYRQKRRYLTEPWFFPVLGLIILAWIGLLWSSDPAGLGLKYAKKSHYWLYAFAMASIGFSDLPVAHLLKAFMGGLLANAMVGFLQLLHFVPRFAEYGKTGYTGFYGGYNTLAILLILGMLTASHHFRRSDIIRNKIIYAMLLSIYFLHLLLLESRGGYLTFIILSPIIIYNLLNGQKKLLMVAMYLLFITLIFTSPVVQFRVQQAIESIQNQIESSKDVAWGKTYGGYIDRIYMWRWAVDLVLKHPFLGVGTGGYKQAILSGGGSRGIAHPHNNFLYMAVSYGIVGVLMLGWLFLVIFTNAWRHRQDVTGFFVLSSVLVIFVGGFTDTHILDAGGAFLFAITTGMLSSLPKGSFTEKRVDP